MQFSYLEIYFVESFNQFIQIILLSLKNTLSIQIFKLIWISWNLE